MIQKLVLDFQNVIPNTHLIINLLGLVYKTVFWVLRKNTLIKYLVFCLDKKQIITVELENFGNYRDTLIYVENLKNLVIGNAIIIVKTNQPHSAKYEEELYQLLNSYLNSYKNCIIFYLKPLSTKNSERFLIENFKKDMLAIKLEI